MSEAFTYTIASKRWRKERDSNPRTPHDVNSFQDCRNKPDSAILPCVTKKNILS